MLNKIIAFARERFSFLGNQNEGNFDITPHRDWFVLVLLSVVASVMFVAVAVYLFLVVNGKETSGVGLFQSGPFEPVHEKELENVLQLFSEKENAFRALFDAPPSVVDPSL